jgi:imidazolonepropionase-like amidohydrolase
MGYTPHEAIIAGTAWGGEIMGQADELGKVQPGYYADLLLVDGNPLDDISLLSKHGKHLDVILINGQIHKNLNVEEPEMKSLEGLRETATTS